MRILAWPGLIVAGWLLVDAVRVGRLRWRAWRFIRAAERAGESAAVYYTAPRTLVGAVRDLVGGLRDRRVARLRVSPERIELRVGERRANYLPAAEAFDRAGRSLGPSQVCWQLEFSDEIAAVERAELVGRAPGRGAIRVRSYLRAGPARGAEIVVPLEVRPAE